MISASRLLAYAKAFVEKAHPLHDFGRACAVELFCRDQFEHHSNPQRSLEAELALFELTVQERITYGVRR